MVVKIVLVDILNVLKVKRYKMWTGSNNFTNHQLIKDLYEIRTVVEFYKEKGEEPKFEGLKEVFGPRRAAMIRQYYKNGRPLTWDD